MVATAVLVVVVVVVAVAAVVAVVCPTPVMTAFSAAHPTLSQPLPIFLFSFSLLLPLFVVCLVLCVVLCSPGCVAWLCLLFVCPCFSFSHPSLCPGPCPGLPPGPSVCC